MKAEIITIGDEILIGQIVDTNSAWIAARLNEAGFTVVRKLTVGDDRREIADAVEGAMRTADAVIVTGGLGPTKDDITKQTLAGIFGGEMVRDRETYERNGRILAARGIEYNELNREQATVPSSAEVLQNMHGTAPGMWFTRGGKAVVSLPGVPFEMKELMETEVMPRLAAHFRQSKVVHRTAITYGLAESVLAATIAEWEAALPGYLHLAYLPSPSQIRLRLSAYDIEGRREEEEIERRFKVLERLIPDYFIGYGDATVASATADLLRARRATLAVAERTLWFGAGKTHGRPKGGHAGECVFGGYSVGCRCSSSSRSMLAAAAAARSMFCVRRRAKTDLQARVPCGVASPIHTVPTGFSGVPPVGPATPVVERA